MRFVALSLLLLVHDPTPAALQFTIRKCEIQPGADEKRFVSVSEILLPLGTWPSGEKILLREVVPIVGIKILADATGRHYPFFSFRKIFAGKLQNLGGRPKVTFLGTISGLT